jgi:hypothetical protein
MITKMNYGLFLSRTQGHIDYNGKQPEKFWKDMSFNLHHMCFVLLSTILPTTQEFRFEKKKKKNFFFQ